MGCKVTSFLQHLPIHCRCVSYTEDEDDEEDEDDNQARICIATPDKKEGREDDFPRKFLKLVHKFNLLSEELNDLSGTIDNSLSKHSKKATKPTISVASSKSVISKHGKQRAVKTKSRVKMRSHLHFLSSCLVFSVLSVSWLCHPQCCDFYQDWQIWPIFSYRDGPPPI